jgi:hypothetical protein
MRNILFVSRFVAAVLFVAASALSGMPHAAEKRPAPQVTGRLIGTDGVRQLIVEYKKGAARETFIGNIHSTCELPAKSNSSPPAPVKLSAIPKGSDLTLFYVRHKQKGGKSENSILAIRFNKLNGDSVLYKGATLP